MTHAVSGLFGAMIALLVYTRLGGMATVLVAGGILVGYILVEMYRGWRELLTAHRASDTARRRYAEWSRDAQAQRFAASRRKLEAIAEDAFAEAAAIRAGARRHRQSSRND